MAIKYEQWGRILSAVNSDKSLNRNNVIKKIKKGLPSCECEEWSKVGCDVNHPFDAVFYSHLPRLCEQNYSVRKKSRRKKEKAVVSPN